MESVRIPDTSDGMGIEFLTPLMGGVHNFWPINWKILYLSHAPKIWCLPKTPKLEKNDQNRFFPDKTTSGNRNPGQKKWQPIFSYRLESPQWHFDEFLFFTEKSSGLIFYDIWTSTSGAHINIRRLVLRVNLWIFMSIIYTNN